MGSLYARDSTFRRKEGKELKKNIEMTTLFNLHPIPSERQIGDCSPGK
jgi:hypothetical protein